MGELGAIDTWLYATLSADATLVGLVAGRVYDSVAPQGAVLPCIVFQHQGAHDVRGNGPGRIMASTVYLVKAIGQGSSFTALEAIANRVDVLLQGQSGSNTKGQCWAVREQPFKLAETDEGIQYRHLGGLYRIWAKEV